MLGFICFKACSIWSWLPTIHHEKKLPFTIAMQALPLLSSVILLLLIFVFLFGVAGIQLFQNAAHQTCVNRVDGSYPDPAPTSNSDEWGCGHRHCPSNYTCTVGCCPRMMLTVVLCLCLDCCSILSCSAQALALMSLTPLPETASIHSCIHPSIQPSIRSALPSCFSFHSCVHTSCLLFAERRSQITRLSNYPFIHPCVHPSIHPSTESSVFPSSFHSLHDTCVLHVLVLPTPWQCCAPSAFS